MTSLIDRFGWICVFVPVLGLIQVAVARAEDPPVFMGVWGGLGSGPGEFGDPVDVAVDGTGNVFVTDYNNHRVQKFNSMGTYITEWGGVGNPTALAVDATGNVYVADWLNRVRKFTNDGTHLLTWGSTGTGDGQFGAPWGIDIGPGGNVYVCDTYQDRVQVFMPDSTLVSVWGVSGTGVGEVSRPWHIVVDETETVWLTELFNNRVQRFTATVLPWVSGELPARGRRVPGSTGN